LFSRGRALCKAALILGSLFVLCISVLSIIFVRFSCFFSTLPFLLRRRPHVKDVIAPDEHLAQLARQLAVHVLLRRRELFFGGVGRNRVSGDGAPELAFLVVLGEIE
jgi:hypothetical protein